MKKQEKICHACGTSPINHTLLYVSNFLDEVLSSVDEVFSRLSTIGPAEKFIKAFEKFLLHTLSAIGFIRYNQDIEKATTGRSKLIWEEARRRGIPMEQMKIFGKCIDCYRSKLHGKTFYFESLPIPNTFSKKGYKWVDDKFTLAKKLSSLSIPSPKTEQVSSLKQALLAFESFQKPVILKPKYGSRGRHTTTNINTREELERAFNLAKEITPHMVIQEHLFGSVYRATVIDNKLVGFFRADQPEIVGDGIHSVSEIIEEKNKTKNERVSSITVTDDLLDFIKRQGLTLESIPEKGRRIILSAKTGRLYGSYTREMLPEVHPRMHEIFTLAGQAAEAPVLGFDLIIEDPTSSPEDQKWGIIECNSLPFIDLHYFALEGTPINLAENVWNLWK